MSVWVGPDEVVLDFTVAAECRQLILYVFVDFPHGHFLLLRYFVCIFDNTAIHLKKAIALNV